MHSSSALILNAIKHMASLPDSIHLLPPEIIASLSHFKQDVLRGTMLSLDLEKTLIALSIGATMKPAAQVAVDKLKKLRGCEVHLTHIPNISARIPARRGLVHTTLRLRVEQEQLFSQLPVPSRTSLRARR